MNAAVHPFIDNDMKIVPSKINERGKVQQGDEKQRKIKALKTKIAQNVNHRNRPLCNPSPPPPITEMTDEQYNTNDYNSNNNNNRTVKINYSETSNQVDGTNNANVNVSKSLTTSKNIQKTQNKNNNNNSKIDKNSNSELIIAEAAKIILKNGLNGTNAAAAAAVVLTAAANFQLPCGGGDSIDAPSTSKPTTAAAAAAQAQLVAIAAAAAAVNVTNKQNCLNSSGSLIKNDHNTITTAAESSPTTKATITTTASSTKTNNDFDATDYIQNNSSKFTPNANITQYQFTKPSQLFTNNNNSTSAMDMGVVDYTINNDVVSKIKTSTVITSSPVSASTTPSPPSLKGNSNASIESNNNNYKQPVYYKHNVNDNNTHHGYELGSLCGTGSDSFLKNNLQNRVDRGGGDECPLSQYSSQHNGSFHSWNKFDLTGSSSSNNTNHTNGGRLQFFKDGKFILELARAKDGEKSRWVYVPRKHFRAPSAATSSTITPCASIFSAAAAAVPSALPASPVSVATVVTGGFPKNECSNSLSFSDDNSSIQSSPWQRDHCFKQTAPQKNISKEMSHFYQRPYFKKLSPQALIKARKKFRKPYNIITIGHDFLYINNKKVEENMEAPQDKNDDRIKDDEIKDNECHKNETNNDAVPTTETNKSVTEVSKLTVADNDTTVLKSDDDLDGDRADGADRITEGVGDGEDVATDNIFQNKAKVNGVKCEAKINEIKFDENGIYTKSMTVTHLHNTQRKLMVSCKTKGKLLVIVQKLTDMCKQRLSKANTISTKTFTKTVPQSSPSTVTLISTSTGIGTMQNTTTTGSHISKVSPSASSSSTSSSSITAASRLVDYHQQHVSPRKRILREMEKVSLEDNGAVGTAKRSRPKRYNNASTTTNIVTTINNSAQNIQLKLSSSTYQSKAPLPVSNSNNSSSTGNTEKFLTNIQNNPPTTKVYSSYSIHSLLSSHGGTNSNNSSNVTAGADGSTKRGDSPPNNQSMQDNAYRTHNSIQPSNALRVTSKSPENCSADGKSSNCTYNNRMIGSPYASPSPGQENRSQSPSCVSLNNMSDYVNYGRRTPDAPHKLRYMGHSSEHISPNYNHHHQQQQHYLQHAPLVAHQQTYYSPYMTSPQYVPTPNKISPRNNTASPISPISSSSSVASSTHAPSSATVPTVKSNSSTMAYMGCRSRSPHRHPSAFRSTTSNMANTCTTSYIPTQKDYSPTRSIPAISGSSARDNIPRTVPKKTASIRRQFASPTISCDGSITNNVNATPTNSNNNHNNNRNSSSPPLNENRSNNESTRICSGSHSGHNNNNDNSGSTEKQQLPISLTLQQQHSAHMLARTSPNLNIAGKACPSLYSYPYQMYMSAASASNGDAGEAHSPRNTPTAHNITVQPSQSQPQPAPPPPPPLPPLPLSSPYIPTVVGSPYYHPYISTLAAMRHPQIWMQHYQNAAPALLQARHSSVSSLTNSRLATSPYHGFHYNGTMTNALAAAVAAAAAAGFNSNALTATATATANQHHTAGLLPLVALPHNAPLFNHTNGSSFVNNMNHTLMGMTGSSSSSTTSTSNTCITPNTLTDHVTTTTTKTTVTIGNSSSLVSLSSSLQSVMAASIVEHDMPSLYAYNHSNKDEQSSDVPLNLSKH